MASKRVNIYMGLDYRLQSALRGKKWAECHQIMDDMDNLSEQLSDNEKEELKRSFWERMQKILRAL